MALSSLLQYWRSLLPIRALQLPTRGALAVCAPRSTARLNAVGAVRRGRARPDLPSTPARASPRPERPPAPRSLTRAIVFKVVNSTPTREEQRQLVPSRARRTDPPTLPSNGEQLAKPDRDSVDRPRAATGVGLAVPPAAPETLLCALLTPYHHRSRGAAAAARLLRPARRVGALEEPAGGLHQHAGAAGVAGGLRVVAALAAIPVRAPRKMPGPAAHPPQAQTPRASTTGTAARTRHRLPYPLQPSLKRVRVGRPAGGAAAVASRIVPSWSVVLVSASSCS